MAQFDAPRSLEPAPSISGAGDRANVVNERVNGQLNQPHILPGEQRPLHTRGEQFREWVDVLVRGRWLILGALLATSIPVTLYTMQLENQYRAFSVLRVEPRESNTLDGLLGGASSIPFSSQNDRFINNEVFLIRQSVTLAERTAEQLIALARVPETGEPLSILGSPTNPPLPVQAVAARLQNFYVSVAPAGQSLDAITITATSKSPGEAALIANLYAEQYIRRTRESSRASLSASRVFLEDQVNKRIGELEGLEGQVREFMTREGAVALDEESRFVVNQLSQLEAMRDEARINLGIRRATLQSLSDELAMVQPNLALRLSSGVQQEISAVQQRKAELEAGLEPIFLRNPVLRTEPTSEIQERLQQIETLRQRLVTLSDQYVNEVLAVGGIDPATPGGAGLQQVAQLSRQIADQRIEISGLEAREQALNSRIRSYEGTMQQIPAQAIELAQLQRARQVTERSYTLLVDKLQELRVAEESELGYAEQIRPAARPGHPFSPNRTRNILIGILAGLGLGLLAAFSRARLDVRLHRPDDIRGLGETVIAVIPDMRKLIKEEHKGADSITLNGHSYATTLVTLLNPFSTISESYRGLRTNIQFYRPDVVVGTILVTSASPSEGKSVTAANLAIVLAQAGRKVLLVDADLRRPTVHKKMGLKRQPGLKELLFETTPFDISRYSTPIDDLYVLCAGGDTPNPSELLGSAKMRELIATFRRHVDIVIFDAPPVLAATDAVLLSTQCDTTIVVAAAGETRTFELQHTYDTLQSVGAKLIGTVFNGFDASKAYGYKYRYRYGYGYRSGYSYGYGPTKDEGAKEGR